MPTVNLNPTFSRQRGYGAPVNHTSASATALAGGATLTGASSSFSNRISLYGFVGVPDNTNTTGTTFSFKVDSTVAKTFTINIAVVRRKFDTDGVFISESIPTSFYTETYTGNTGTSSYTVTLPTFKNSEAVRGQEDPYSIGVAVSFTTNSPSSTDSIVLFDCKLNQTYSTATELTGSTSIFTGQSGNFLLTDTLTPKLNSSKPDSLIKSEDVNLLGDSILNLQRAALVTRYGKALNTPADDVHIQTITVSGMFSTVQSSNRPGGYRTFSRRVGSSVSVFSEALNLSNILFHNITNKSFNTLNPKVVNAMAWYVSGGVNFPLGVNIHQFRVLASNPNNIAESTYSDLSILLWGIDKIGTYSTNNSSSTRVSSVIYQQSQNPTVPANLPFYIKILAVGN